MVSAIFAIALVAAGITVALVPVIIGLVLQHRHDAARSSRAVSPTTKLAPTLPEQSRHLERAA